MGNLIRQTAAGLYHVCARSNAEEHIFRNELDYLAAVHLLGDAVGQGFVVCHAFVINPTHYHVLGTFPDRGLETFGHRFNRAYASGFNDRHGRRGRVFDGPYKSPAVETERHLLWLARYLADNPPHRPWPWSSQDASFPFVDPSPLIEAFGSRAQWLEFVAA